MKFLIFVVALFSLSTSAAELTKVRIGWLTSWTTQGQLVQIWKHSDILQKNGIEAEFTAKRFGPELKDLALSNSIDVMTAGDQSAINLFALDKGWKAIGRLQYSRTAIYVPSISPIKTVEDLKGKTIGVPVGSSAEMDLISALKRAKLDPVKDVKIVNVAIQDQPVIAGKAGMKPTWEQYDAFAGYDPIPALLEANGRARKISEEKMVGLVLANEEFLKKNKKIEEKIMKSVGDAYKYYAKNSKQANEWFLAEAGFKDPEQKACAIAASIEPNTKGKTVLLQIGAADIKGLQATADFMEPQLKKKLDVNKFIVK